MKIKEKYKRYGVALMSFIFMVTIAGYINYRYNPEREKNLGQTVYVSTNDDSVKIYEEEKENEKEIKPISTIEKYKTDRDNMYIELANNYNQVINNENSSQEMIDMYQEKINNLLEEKNKIMMTENIIKSRGIKECVIVITDKNFLMLSFPFVSISAVICFKRMFTILLKNYIIKLKDCK